MNIENVQRIRKIVDASTVVYRKGEAVEKEVTPGGVEVTHLMGYPHVSEMPTTQTAVDMVFVTVGVRGILPDGTPKALREALGDGIFPEYATNMADGPSYIHLGAELGSQDTALRFMALGKVCGLWDIATVAAMGITDEAQIREYAGKGFLYAIGWTS